MSPLPPDFRLKLYKLLGYVIITTIPMKLLQSFYRSIRCLADVILQQRCSRVSLCFLLAYFMLLDAHVRGDRPIDGRRTLCLYDNRLTMQEMLAYHLLTSRCMNHDNMIYLKFMNVLKIEILTTCN